MAFRAENVQASELDHLVMFLAAALLVSLDELMVAVAIGDDGLLGFHQLPARKHLWIAAEHDVRTATSHVGGNGDCPFAPRLSNDVRFILVVLGIQHVMLDALLLENSADRAALFYARRADQDRPPLLVLFEDLADDGRKLLTLGLVDDVLKVLANHCPVRW